MTVLLSPFRTPKYLCILTPSNLSQKNGFPVVKALTPVRLDYVLIIAWEKRHKLTILRRQPAPINGWR